METQVRPSTIYRFGPYQVDIQAGQLRKHGTRVRLAGQPFEILVMLLERAGAAVTREEIQKRLWPNETFGDFENSLNKAINKLRQALTDNAERPAYVETLPRQGYRFIAPLVEAETRNAGEITQPPQLSMPGPAVPPERPYNQAGSVVREASSWSEWLRLKASIPVVAILLLAILMAMLAWQFAPSFGGRSSAVSGPKTLAVIEIENLSQDPSLNWLGNGLVDLLATDLAQAKSLDVISTERIRGLIRRQVKGDESLDCQSRRKSYKTYQTVGWVVGWEFLAKTALNATLHGQ